MSEHALQLRVALICGTLDYGGSEKQMVYTARVLLDAGFHIHVYSLARGAYEAVVKAANIPVSFVEQGPPPKRLAALVARLWRFQPHFVQSTHAFANLYAALAARAVGALGIGALRSDLRHCRDLNGAWAQWLIRVPAALFVNSRRAEDDVLRAGMVRRDRIYLLPNAVEIVHHKGFADRKSERQTAVVVSRLIEAKRIDRFLRGLRLARETVPKLCGVIIGDGPDRLALTDLARELGLFPEHVTFLGARADTAQRLCEYDMTVLTSDHEATPNAILEAMAASLPVITTASGDSARIVQDGVRGFVVPFDDERVLAERLRRLAVDPNLRRAMGEAGRRWVEQEHSVIQLRRKLLEAYRDLAPASLKPRLLELCACG